MDSTRKGMLNVVRADSCRWGPGETPGLSQDGTPDVPWGPRYEEPSGESAQLMRGLARRIRIAGKVSEELIPRGAP